MTPIKDYDERNCWKDCNCAAELMEPEDCSMILCNENGRLIWSDENFKQNFPWKNRLIKMQINKFLIQGIGIWTLIRIGEAEFRKSAISNPIIKNILTWQIYQIMHLK